MQHTHATEVFVDWEQVYPGTLRLTLSLVMLAATIVLGGRRIVWLIKLITIPRRAGSMTSGAARCPRYTRCSVSVDCCAGGCRARCTP